MHGYKRRSTAGVGEVRGTSGPCAHPPARHKQPEEKEALALTQSLGFKFQHFSTYTVKVAQQMRF